MFAVAHLHHKMTEHFGKNLICAHYQYQQIGGELSMHTPPTAKKMHPKKVDDVHLHVKHETKRIPVFRLLSFVPLLIEGCKQISRLSQKQQY